ncbi:MAG: hypothetical protein ACR2HR_06980 [Euzebya sp.]
MTATPSDSPESATDELTGSPPEPSPSPEPPQSDGPPAPAEAEPEPTAEVEPEPTAEVAAEAAPEPDATAAALQEDAKKRKKKEKKKPSGPDPVAVMKRIGTTSEAALVYVKDPDPKLSRMARKHREAIITDIPPVTAGALLGPDALCRHFLASAASGRYQDLFFLWDLFVSFPEECKAVLAARQKAQEKAKAKLKIATHLGLLGDADRVASDIDRASGLPWRWLKEVLDPMGAAISQRPSVLAAMTRKNPDQQFDIPADPSDRWLAEAAALKDSGATIPPAIDEILGANADRLPATVATLSMAHSQYPDRVSALIDRVDLDAPDIGAIMAWSRDHGHGEQLVNRVRERVQTAAEQDRAGGLAAWKQWQARGVDMALPESLLTPSLEGLDLGRPESAELIKTLIDGGADLDAQQILDDIAAENRMRGEKAFEAFVCAGFDNVHLPLALEGNPMVRTETRCPSCQAWTWVRPGLEKRCPRTGCPLRDQTGVATPDQTVDIDAAVAGIDAGGSAAPSVPAEVSTPQPRPSAPPPAAQVEVPAPEAPTPEVSTPEEPAPVEAESDEAESVEAESDDQPAADQVRDQAGS